MSKTTPLKVFVKLLLNFSVLQSQVWTILTIARQVKDEAFVFLIMVNVMVNMDIGYKMRKQRKKVLSQNLKMCSGHLMIRVKHGSVIALNSVD